MKILPFKDCVLLGLFMTAQGLGSVGLGVVGSGQCELTVLAVFFKKGEISDKALSGLSS